MEVVIFLPILCHILSPEHQNSIVSILYLSEALVRRRASASSCSNLPALLPAPGFSQLRLSDLVLVPGEQKPSSSLFRPNLLL